MPVDASEDIGQSSKTGLNDVEAPGSQGSQVQWPWSLVEISSSLRLLAIGELQAEGSLDARIDIALCNGLCACRCKVEVELDLGSAVDKAEVAIVQVSTETKAGFTGECSKDRAYSQDCNQKNCNSLFHNSSAKNPDLVDLVGDSQQRILKSMILDIMMIT